MKKIAFRLNFLTACVSLGIASQASAGHTYFGINYQYYRDFAENKGKFTVGAQDIDIYNKKGEMIGTMMKGVPMPDLSSLAKGGYATLVGDQTLISVAHNVGYQDVDFGMTGHNPDQHNFKYKVVKRYNYKNDSTHRYMTDYQHPRLAKFVTEVAPIEMVSRMNGKVYTDLKKYPMRVRVGSGHQYWKDDNNNTNADLAYGGAWLTGGNTFMDGGTGDGHLYLNGRVQTPNEYGPLPIAGAQGDSGSPFFIYDKEQGKWLLNGVLREGHPYAAVGNGYQIARQDYLEEVLEQDLAARFFLNNANYTLKTTQDGNGTITQNGRRSQTIGLYNSALPFDSRGGNNGDEAPTYKGPNPWSPALHHGKNIYLGDMGKGTLTIENTVNQGAGGLYFEGDFAVKPSDNTVTWQGAGVSVGEESTVEWQVHNPEGDRLSKIGLGTLLVNGKGKNLGSLSVGNGLVVLDQQADEAGQKQAFKEVGIVSGRATVKLNSENQVDPNNIYFGFRGGRLDLNGHSLTFERIQNIDEGAMLVNHNETQAANITITGNATVNSDTKQLTNKKYIAFNGWFGEQDKAKTNGRLNVNYQPVNAENHLLLSGGTNLNGNITQNGGTLVFSGRPTPHAYNHLNQNHAKMEGSTRGEVIIDDDWINRTFTAENFQIQNGQAVVSRNVSAINGNWQLSNNAKATFGVTPNQENLVCIRSDWTGLTECKSENLTEQKTIDSLPRTKVNGNVHLMSSASAVASGLVDLIGNVSLAQNSQFTLGNNATQTGSLNLVNQANATVNNARLMGNVTLSDSAQFNLANSRFSHQISGTESTTVNLENANWTMPASTTLGSLVLNNSEITLNPDFVTQTNNSQFNTLTINGNLSGNGIFNYRTYLNQYLGDKLQVNGQAQGDFKLKVHNTGAEPTALEHLTLMTLKQMPSSGLNVTLADNYVDAGTWRYELVKDGNQYRLYSPMKETELQAEEAKRLAEEQRKAEEAKRLAEEQRKAEEAKRLAEEQRKAEEARRLAEEQRKEEEAKRLAEEQRKAEEAKRLAEEQRKAEEAKRLAEEQRKAEEAKRLAEEQRKAEEAKRLAEEQRKAEEAKRLAEEQRKAEEEQRKAEEAKRLAEEQRKAEEAKRLAEEQRKAEEAKRLAEEQRKAEEAKRLAEEQRKAEEAKRLAEEQRKAEEAKRLAEEQRKAEEAKRLAEEQRKAEEAKRLAEEQRKAEEVKRLAEEQRKAEEAKRLAEEQRKAEEAKRLAEEQRKVEEAKRLAEEQRKAEEAKRLAEEQRQAEEAKRLAEEQRKAEEAKRLAEEQRKAEEAKRLAEEQRKAEEAKRLAEEQRKAEEAKRLAEEQLKAEEAKRLAEEQRKAEEAKRLAEEQRKAEEAKRLAEEQRKAEEAKRLAEEQRKAEEAKRLAEEQRQAEEAKRLAEEQRKAEEAKRLAEEQRKAEEAKRLAEEQRKAEEAKRLAEEQRKAEEAKRLAEEQRKAEEAKRLAEEQRKAEEAKRLAEEQRKAEEAKRLAEEQRKVEEAKRLAEEQRKAEEVKRLAEEQRKAEEAKRLAEEQRKAEEAKRLAEEQRKAEEAKRLAEEQRKAEEAKRLAEEQRKAEEAKRKQKELISRYSNSALSELSATVNSMLSVQHELDRVLVSDSDLSVWTNITQDKKRYDSDDFRAYQQNMNLRQIGVKKKVENGRIGAIFSHGRANNTFDEQISNQMDLTMVSAFAQYQWHDWQLGVNAGYGVSSSKISGEQSQKIHRRVMSYGLNANYQFRLGELGVQPYLGVSRHFIEGENYQYEGVNIQTPKIAFNSYTTGVKVDYTFTPAQDVTIKPYFSVNYVDASNARVQTKVNQATLQQQFGRYLQKELGVSGEISHFHMSVYAAQSQGSQLSKQRTLGVKLGYRW
ncbi:S6 family peptidase [Haemophilus sputorum]|uniref:Autotransporter outer membrane beta-barrel domain-containing protein n=1 Tax=Haemophilus sputorum TaxID=1078480 RepID=A0ABX9HQD6_9PAST|nr:S6 family peptidase [Haemophilus sputorum]RDF06880.1 autotransporter outer membrane beta-barrel domain-containing protein [Haemophilus sputorum]RDF10917.1 autotransporter outer membrane beta-barrel domain-containing protein [Haemophilus sputorum]